MSDLVGNLEDRFFHVAAQFEPPHQKTKSLHNDSSAYAKTGAEQLCSTCTFVFAS